MTWKLRAAMLACLLLGVDFVCYFAYLLSFYAIGTKSILLAEPPVIYVVQIAFIVACMLIILNYFIRSDSHGI